MMEYGGYLEMEHYNGKEFHNNCIKLNTGRNCLRYLILAKKIKKIFLPSYICDSVIDICLKENVDINYYCIDNNFRPIIDFELNDGEYLYIINYYGQLTNEEIKIFKSKYDNIIIDNIQAFFQENINNIDTIYTCRKFFGVSDGAYLYTNCKLQKKLDRDSSIDRIKYLLGRYEFSAQEYFLSYRENEENLDNLEIKEMSAITSNILKSIDYNYVKEKREDNYKIYFENFKNINKLNNLICPIGPYMYPLLVENGKKIKLELQNKKIFIPTFWPNIDDNNKLDSYLKDNIISLPCDQRYNEEDINYIIKTILELL